LYEQTLQLWTAAERSRNPDVVTLLGPKLDVSAIHFQLALVEYSRQLYDAAIAQLDACLKDSPKNSYAIFLRARAKDALRLNGPAADDYGLAAQTARENNDSTWNVGQAHYYRGLLLFQNKDFMRAESEFANAQSARLGDIPPQDVTAWKLLAAVSGSNCKLGVDYLETAVDAATSQFPKATAQGILFDCRIKQAATLEQLLALEKLSNGRLDAGRLRDLRTRIANLYADQGIAAEDRKDPYAAVVAYRHAIEWDPVSSKARFNLGAIYIDDKRYNLAEAEYRALVEADANDFEAQYWLAESILAQRPAPERRVEACRLLQRSVAIADAEKKAQFEKALVAAKCPN
jgi:TolA-binding protein